MKSLIISGILFTLFATPLALATDNQPCPIDTSKKSCCQCTCCPSCCSDKGAGGTASGK